MHKKGFIDMVKGLLAWLNKVFWVFKVFWSNSFVSNAIYRRKIITIKQGNNKIEKPKCSEKCQLIFVKY